MSALAMAMVLTGAGALSLGDAQRPGPPPPPYHAAPPVPPPPPSGSARPPRRARANLNSYFSADDYPAMEDGRQEGTVGFRLTVGPNGRVTDCRVTSSSGAAALDQATCRILRSRARYTPARDSAGNPTTGSDSGRVTWRLPDDTEGPDDRRAGIPMPFARAERRAPLQSYIPARDHPAGAGDRATGVTSVRLVVGPAGRVIACDVLEDRGILTLMAAPPPAGPRAPGRATRPRAVGRAGSSATSPSRTSCGGLPPRRAGAAAGRSAARPRHLPGPGKSGVPVPAHGGHARTAARSLSNSRIAAAAPSAATDGDPAAARPPKSRRLFQRRRLSRRGVAPGEEGMVGFRLTIGRDGRVSRCRVTSTSGSAALDRATCALLRRRARYRPARDAGGRPTRGTNSGRVSWLLPVD